MRKKTHNTSIRTYSNMRLWLFVKQTNDPDEWVSYAGFKNDYYKYNELMADPFSSRVEYIKYTDRLRR